MAKKAVPFLVCVQVCVLFVGVNKKKKKINCTIIVGRGLPMHEIHGLNQVGCKCNKNY